MTKHRFFTEPKLSFSYNGIMANIFIINSIENLTSINVANQNTAITQDAVNVTHTNSNSLFIISYFSSLR